MYVKYLIVILSAVLIFGGLYFKFLYDVPDGQDLTNTWVSWSLVALGIGGIMVGLLWKKHDPLAAVIENRDDTKDEENDNSDFKWEVPQMESKSAKKKNDSVNIISTSNLTKRYGNFVAVVSLNLHVKAGDIFGFLGPNGAGKTTTIRMLCGLLQPTSGKAEVASFDIIKENTKIRNLIGLVPESLGFYNWMNPTEYLLYFATLYKIEPETAKKRTGELLKKVGLAGSSHIPIGYFSRGMKQRLGVARALINEPQIIFLDEPTLGLDPKGQKEIRRLLLEINHKNGATIFLSSHELGEVSSLCNRIAILNRGKLVAQGTLEELKKLVEDKEKSDRLLIRVLNSETARESLTRLPFKMKANVEHDIINIILSDSSYGLNHIIDAIEEAGLQIHEIKRMEMSLEEVYFKITEQQEIGGKERAYV